VNYPSGVFGAHGCYIYECNIGYFAWKYARAMCPFVWDCFRGFLEVIHWAGRGESVESWGACANHQLAPQCKAWRPIIGGQSYV
jgi:hypothetical protein